MIDYLDYSDDTGSEFRYCYSQSRVICRINIEDRDLSIFIGMKKFFEEGDVTLRKISHIEGDTLYVKYKAKRKTKCQDQPLTAKTTLTHARSSKVRTSKIKRK